MTTSIDLVAGPVATQLIAQFGKTLQYTKRTSGSYDPSTSSSVANDPVVFTIKGVVENFLRPLDGGNFDPATLISANDKKVTVAASSFSSPPILDDQIDIDGVGFKIVNIKAEYSGDLIAYYDFRVRH